MAINIVINIGRDVGKVLEGGAPPPSLRTLKGCQIGNPGFPNPGRQPHPLPPLPLSLSLRTPAGCNILNLMFAKTWLHNVSLLIMRILPLLILSLFLTGAADISAADSTGASERLELLLRLDSLEVEKQTLKRQGRPLRELETAAAQLRDSLSAMRGHIAPSAHRESASGKSFSLPFSLPASLAGIPLAPRNLLDWVIVGVGAVALLSGLLLIIGILSAARAKKRRAASPNAKAVKKDKAQSKRMNLAPPENYTAAQPPEIPKIAPMPAAPQTPPAFGGYDFAGRGGAQFSAETQNKRETLSPAPDDEKTIALLRERILSASAPQTQQTASAPLFVTADQPPAPSKPAPFSAPFAAANATPQELVLSASQEGLSAQEISKRHQISIDQVNLILRMAKK